MTTSTTVSSRCVPEPSVQAVLATRASMKRPEPHVLVVFGATGDLAKRKLLPGLYHLHVEDLLPAQFRLVASARAESSDREYAALAREACEQFGRREVEEASWREFESLISYASVGDPGSPALADAVHRGRAALGSDSRVLHYLSVPPVASAGLVRLLGAAGLAEGARVIMEKPFGTDLESARELNDTVHEVFAEEQVYRIDHFLGKEAVQNILALRFSNGLFEPIWNRDHIQYVQIDVPETLSIGTRAGFYEDTGAFRDMIVTHLFHVLGFVAMEPPTSLTQGSLAAETDKVFAAMTALKSHEIVRGQYEGYKQVQGVARDSSTETFVALRAHVENWRWSGVPFLLRTGKLLAEGRRVVTIGLREPPLQMFPLEPRAAAGAPNTLSFDLGEPGSVVARFLAKEPGATMDLGPGRMRFDYSDSFCVAHQLEAYERLIHDAMIGDHTLFTTAAGIERLWEISTPVLDDPPPVEPYPAGSWGPDAIHALVAPHHWHLPDDHPSEES